MFGLGGMILIYGQVFRHEYEKLTIAQKLETKKETIQRNDLKVTFSKLKKWQFRHFQYINLEACAHLSFSALS